MVWNEAWKANIPVLKPIGDADELWGVPDKTLLAYSNATYKHIHNPSRIIPDDCTTIDVVTAAGANAFGNFVEIIAATTTPIDFHWANIVEVGAVGVYIIEFAIIDGAAPPAEVTYLGVISVSRLDNFTKASQMTVQIPVIPSGVRVGARVKSLGGGGATVRFSLIYHDYD